MNVFYYQIKKTIKSIIKSKLFPIRVWKNIHKMIFTFFILSQFIKQKYIYLSKSIQLTVNECEKEINYVHKIDKQKANIM